MSKYLISLKRKYNSSGHKSILYFEFSVEWGCFPGPLKKAITVHVYTKDDKSKAENY